MRIAAVDIGKGFLLWLKMQCGQFIHVLDLTPPQEVSFSDPTPRSKLFIGDMAEPSNHNEQAAAAASVCSSLVTGSSSIRSRNVGPIPAPPVGFECEFIERPKELQTDCPICLMVLRNPYQATCCGYIYCHSCIEWVQSSRKPCPTCNSTEFMIFSDKGLHKSLYAFKVWCSKKAEGCNWAGELGTLASHLNDDFTHGLRSEGCEFVIVNCSQCSKGVARKILKKHEDLECLQRRYTCPVCKDFCSTFIDVTERHQPHCLPYHRSIQHPIVEEQDQVACEFSFAGCMELSVPEKVQEHLDVNVKTHLSLVASAYSVMKERLREMQTHLDDNNKFIDNLFKEKHDMKEKFQEEITKIRDLRYELEELKTMQHHDRESIEMLQNNSSILPLTVTLKEYIKRSKQKDMSWTSTPFYTHRNGYRMCLWVDIGGNRSGKGMYLSVFSSLLKGKYDGALSWPFRGSIMVQLLSQTDPKMRHIEVIKYHASTPKASSGRIMEEGIKAKPWGKVKFLRHEELKEGGFLVNDMMKFHIIKL